MSKKKLKFKDIILFEDDNLIFVNKPSGMSTLNDRTPGKIGLLEWAREYHEEATVCHRLDKETSGVLVIAKNNDAFKHITLQFEHRQVTKIYHAFVNGVHEFDKTLVDQPIAKSARGGVRIDWREGKDSATFFTTLQAFKMNTLLECRPVTGRMHQIRVHLSHLRAPIIGDSLYGGKDLFLSQIKKKFNIGKFEVEKPLIQRVALHAQGIILETPDGQELGIEAPYPKDMRALLNQLNKNR